MVVARCTDKRVVDDCRQSLGRRLELGHKRLCRRGQELRQRLGISRRYRSTDDVQTAWAFNIAWSWLFIWPEHKFDGPNSQRCLCCSFGARHISAFANCKNYEINCVDCSRVYCVQPRTFVAIIDDLVRAPVYCAVDNRDGY